MEFEVAVPGSPSLNSLRGPCERKATLHLNSGKSGTRNLAAKVRKSIERGAERYRSVYKVEDSHRDRTEQCA